MPPAARGGGPTGEVHPGQGLPWEQRLGRLGRRGRLPSGPGGPYRTAKIPTGLSGAPGASKMARMQREEQVLELAREAGFDLAGIAPLHPPPDADRLAP